MPAEADAVQAQLAVWRVAGADRLHPARFRFIEALAVRAARHDGSTRQLLDARLGALMAAYADALARHEAAAPADDTRAMASVGGALAPLLGTMAAARHAQGGDEGASPQLPALAEFRRIWAELLGERRLRQSLAPQPADAGPLNSGVLVHRAIAHMRATSPEYLRHFLSYTDHLGWLERLYLERAPAPATLTGPGRRAAPRKRRG